MEIYGAFAHLYDELMEEVPYDEWARDIIKKLKKYGITGGIAADLGCGTGQITRRLQAAGFDMIGVDSSAEMLEEAAAHRDNKELRGEICGEEEAAAEDERDPKTRKEPDILYIQQDLRELDLYGTVTAAVSVCDCLNYLLEEEELGQVFALVCNFLDPGGIFIFDMNTPYKYKHLLGDSTFAGVTEDAAYVWENTWDEEEKLNFYDLTMFIREEGTELYRRVEETHCQRGYAKETICRLLEENGFIVEEVCDGYSDEKAGENSERICFIARENRKTV